MDSAKKLKFTNKLTSLANTPEKRAILRDLFCDQSDTPRPASPVIKKKRNKLWEFCNSAPVWGALGAMFSIFASAKVSVVLVYATIWGAFCIEFIRLKIGEDWPHRRYRYGVNILFSVALSFGIYFAYPLLPKPKEEPDLDGKLATFRASLLGDIKKDIPAPVIEIPKPHEHTSVAYYPVSQLGEMNGQTPPTIRTGNSIMIPIGFHNVGEYPVREPHSDQTCILVKRDDVNREFERVKKTFTFHSAGGTLPAHSGGGSYATSDCPPIPDDFFSLKTGICGFGAVRWTDDTGTYETDSGQCLVAEPGGKSWNWHSVKQNNREIRLR